MNYAERRKFLWILFLAGLALLAAAASATTFSRLQFDDLAREATGVARLRCLSSQTVWAHGEIWTDWKFAVLSAEKGVLQPVITVRTPGGRLGDTESRVDGTPKFMPGEEVYLFLWERAGEPYRVLGWTQGTFQIRKHGETNRETVSQESAATAIYDPNRKSFVREGMRDVPVADFLAKLRNSLERVR